VEAGDSLNASESTNPGSGSPEPFLLRAAPEKDFSKSMLKYLVRDLRKTSVFALGLEHDLGHDISHDRVAANTEQARSILKGDWAFP
jgi:hypothetical protein